MAETKYIIFTLGQQKYSMKLSDINGIEHVYNVVTFPVSAEYVKGIIHLRDTVIPVYDLKARFEIEDELSAGDKQLLVAETHSLKMGFEVDDVLGIISVQDEDVYDVPDVVKCESTGYLENVIKICLPESGKSEIVISISVDNIMSDNEYDKISEALDKAQSEN